MKRSSETKAPSHVSPNEQWGWVFSAHAAPVENWRFSKTYVVKPTKAGQEANMKFPKTLSWEEVNQRFGITEEDLANCEEDEFE